MTSITFPFTKKLPWRWMTILTKRNRLNCEYLIGHSLFNREVPILRFMNLREVFVHIQENQWNWSSIVEQDMDTVQSTVKWVLVQMRSKDDVFLHWWASLTFCSYFFCSSIHKMTREPFWKQNIDMTWSNLLLIGVRESIGFSTIRQQLFFFAIWDNYSDDARIMITVIR